MNEERSDDCPSEIKLPAEGCPIERSESFPAERSAAD